ncbi:threonine/serine ThrE exporter family protein [Corynebacterium pelargi]|uniref:threonine/serine ThrE exporter family protein n=1 Tax=Corynebacterium pelargi TaxID=1471400 RepID=UPI001008D9EC|nr:threonine/serine exporter family protein [Corynebacterium pelargi]GGG80410.1 hypothetical protein GCM10007338_18660 [Corynebacterium pelargi]
MVKIFRLDHLATLRKRQQQSPNNATIDVAAAPPLAPLAPVDLADRAEITAALEVSARIGALLITAGTPNSDAEEQVRSIAEAFGVWNCHTDATHKRIRLFTSVGGQQGVQVVHIIKPEAQNFRKLALVDRLIRDIHTGRAALVDATARLDAIENSRESRGEWSIIASWATMSLGVSMLIGGDIPVQIISTIVAAVIMWLSGFLGKHGLPLFYQNAAGGVLAAIVATYAYHAGLLYDLSLKPSIVISTSIVVMLAGLTLLQAFQNGVTSAPITALARLFDTMTITAGVVAGVGMGIAITSVLGLQLPPMETVPVPNFASNTVRTLGGTIATIGFSRACYANWNTAIIAGLTALWGSLVYYFVLVPVGIDGMAATFGTTFVIGLSGGLLARRFQIPPLVIAIAGATPLLPGLSVYRGLYGLMQEQLLAGFSGLVYAIATCTMLAAGTVFGEWVARQLRRPPTMATYKQLAKKMIRTRRAQVRFGVQTKK